VSRESLYRRALGLPPDPGTHWPGTFLYLDGGTLDLGLVRDSQLENVSDYQIFGEAFEGMPLLDVYCTSGDDV
jgi:hypothetical protein